MICQECHMDVPDGPGGRAGYHPHLHCVLWRSYHRDPAELLAEHGYYREREVSVELENLLRWKQDATSVLDVYATVAELVHTVQPTSLGSSHAQNVLDFVRDAVRHWGEHCAQPSMSLEGKVGAAHPETSHSAARERSHQLAWGNDRTEALELLCDRGNATAAEVHAHMARGSRNQWATRLLELREMGLVEYDRTPDGKVLRRATGPNATGRVQTPTPEGRQRLYALRKRPRAGQA